MTKQKCNSNNPNGNLDKSTLTLNEWYSFQIQNYKTGVVKLSTIQNYCCIYNNHIKKFLGYMPLCEIRTMHIQQMHNSLGLSSKYQHRIHAILSNIFEIAVQDDLIVKNPCCHTYFLPFCMTAMQFIEFRSAYFNFVSEWYHIEFQSNQSTIIYN